MTCPLCQSQNNKKELFIAKNVFISSGKLDKNPTSINNYKHINNIKIGGGGILQR
ncbi:sugar transferase [Campylobacter hepaticus]|uniref:sugar transferase n=1 Tax=Campylobacter hepaticus TaxID=1813019 RepID=UPI0029A4C724|nr:sugar transferase [Campylobacter hepaticus]MDX2397851.1 sugar transferase [Campylobacter hepaticus]